MNLGLWSCGYLTHTFPHESGKDFVYLLWKGIGIPMSGFYLRNVLKVILGIVLTLDNSDKATESYSNTDTSFPLWLAQTCIWLQIKKYVMIITQDVHSRLVFLGAYAHQTFCLLWQKHQSASCQKDIFIYLFIY